MSSRAAKPRKVPFDFPYCDWCRLWLWVQHRRQALAALLHKKSSDDLDSAFAATSKQFERTLGKVLKEIDADRCDDLVLIMGYACLAELEQRAVGDVARRWDNIQAIRLGARDYVLVPPLTHTARDADGKRLFKLDEELAIDGTLGMRFRWLEIKPGHRIVHQRVGELAALQDVSPLRIGLAPFACLDDMNWSADPTDTRGLDRRVPVRCTGGKELNALARRLEDILAAAWHAHVHILLLPELVVDDDLLRRCSAWLLANNLNEPRLHLVIAGSRHHGNGKDFVNRCTVLGQIGDTLWHQDKRSPFVIDDQPLLQRLFPDLTMAKAFEPPNLGETVILADSAIGRLLTPICLDYVEGELWPELGADVFLVPAMSGNLGRFVHQAKEMGKRHGAASFVCNARNSGNLPDRCLAYLPVTQQPAVTTTNHAQLFTVDTPMKVK